MDKQTIGEELSTKGASMFKAKKGKKEIVTKFQKVRKQAEDRVKKKNNVIKNAQAIQGSKRCEEEIQLFFKIVIVLQFKHATFDSQ